MWNIIICAAYFSHKFLSENKPLSRTYYVLDMVLGLGEIKDQ